MNKIFLTGRICRDLDLRATSTGKSVCEFTIAVNRDKENADFITVRVWEKAAENLVKYQTKGSLLGVLGELRVDTYTKNDGSKGYKTYVLANQIEYLSSKATQEETQEATQENDPYAEYGEQVEVTDDFLD